MKKLAKIFASALIMANFLVVAAPVATVAAAPAPVSNFAGFLDDLFGGAENPNKTAICEGVGLTTGTNKCTDKAKTDEGAQKLISAVITLLSMAVGVVSIIMIIIGGFKYVMSNGDSNGINSAKNTILYALVGLVVVAMAQVIVNFVLNKL